MTNLDNNFDNLDNVSILYQIFLNLKNMNHLINLSIVSRDASASENKHFETFSDKMGKIAFHELLKAHATFVLVKV